MQFIVVSNTHSFLSAKNYNNDRYVDLTGITIDNVAQMKPVWTFKDFAFVVDLERRAGSYLAEMGPDVARRRTFSAWCGWRPSHDKIG